MLSKFENKSIASKEFEKAVARFKQNNKLETLDFLSNTEKHSTLIQDFFTDPVINGYLTRRADTIIFLNNKPANICLTPSELDIYTKKPDIFVYRSLAHKEDFYQKGVAFGRELIYQNKRMNNEKVAVTVATDIWRIRDILNSVSSNNDPAYSKAAFILTPNWSYEHSILMIHIIDPGSRMVLVSVLINSRYKSGYTKMMSDYLNYYAHKYNSTGHHESYNRIIPAVDASHELQESGDEGCTLYTKNILDAVLHMLQENTSIADRILDLAITLNKDKNQEAASNELTHIFREDLKKYLPCYYENGTKKSLDLLKEFQLKQRWNIDSDILASMFSPEYVKDLMLEPGRPEIFKPRNIYDKNTSSLIYLGKSEVVVFVFKHILPILEKEKIRLINTNNKSTFLVPLSSLINEIYEELAQFEEKQHKNPLALKQTLKSMIEHYLDSIKQEKQDDNCCERFSLVLSNTMLCLTIVAAPIKKIATGSWFFNNESRTEQCIKSSLDGLTTPSKQRSSASSTFNFGVN